MYFDVVIVIVEGVKLPPSYFFMDRELLLIDIETWHTHLVTLKLSKKQNNQF